MRISYNWLKEYVDINVSAEKLAEILTMAGLSVESCASSGSDHILEIEITANRPDWLSYIGVAREVAALTDAIVKMPPSKKIESIRANTPLAVKVEDHKLCPRYTARVIRNLKVGPSPAWLKARVETMGLRSVNAVVDVTNLCLFETGQPMHVFDLDKLSGKGLIIRRAQKGESLTVIEGAQKSLDDSMLIVADNQKPVAIAGIMGGINTEVSGSTTAVVLEVASFDPVSIRRTSRKTGITSESSYRFERKVDADTVASASDRATALILELAGGQAEEFIDIDSRARKFRNITLKYENLAKVLGLMIDSLRIEKIAGLLGMKIKSSSADALELDMPSFRHDLKAEIDVIEEIARIYGYGSIPATLPNIVEQPVRVEPDIMARSAIRQSLTGMGVDEIVSYSLLSKKIIALTGSPADAVIEVENPLTSEQEAMRPNLIAGMLTAMLWNINRKMKDLRLFELGCVYVKSPSGDFKERHELAIGMTGQSFMSWAGGNRQASFYELKGIIECLMTEVGIKDVSFRNTGNGSFLTAERAEIVTGDVIIGIIGAVSAKILEGFGIKEKAYICLIDADVVGELAKTKKVFETLPKYPSICRDISLLADSLTHNGDIVGAIRYAGGPILKDVRLIDRYKGKQIPADKVSLTYRLEYQDPSRTLEEKDVAQVHDEVLKTLDKKFGAKLRL